MNFFVFKKNLNKYIYIYIYIYIVFGKYVIFAYLFIFLKE